MKDEIDTCSECGCPVKDDKAYDCDACGAAMCGYSCAREHECETSRKDSATPNPPGSVEHVRGEG